MTGRPDEPGRPVAGVRRRPLGGPGRPPVYSPVPRPPSPVVTASPDRPSDVPDAASSGDPLGWVRPAPAPPPSENNRVSMLTVRLKRADRDRIDAAAGALGLSTSEYVRGQLLSPDGIDAPAWRVAYQLVVTAVAVAVEQGVSDEALGTLRELHEGFEETVANVFSQAAPTDEGGG